MCKVEQIPRCTLEGLSILSRPSNGHQKYDVIMTFTDETQRPDLLTGEGYQTLAGPFSALFQAKQMKSILEQRIAEEGLDRVIEGLIAG